MRRKELIIIGIMVASMTLLTACSGCGKEEVHPATAVEETTVSETVVETTVSETVVETTVTEIVEETMEEVVDSKVVKEETTVEEITEEVQTTEDATADEPIELHEDWGSEKTEEQKQQEVEAEAEASTNEVSQQDMTPQPAPQGGQTSSTQQEALDKLKAMGITPGNFTGGNAPGKGTGHYDNDTPIVLH